MRGILGGLDEAERAAADAGRLRGLYGARAEDWCATALVGLSVDDPRRTSIRLIVKALRRLPAVDTNQTAPAARPNIAAAEPDRQA